MFGFLVCRVLVENVWGPGGTDSTVRHFSHIINLTFIIIIIQFSKNLLFSWLTFVLAANIKTGSMTT